MNIPADIYPTPKAGPVCTRQRSYYATPSVATSDDSCVCAYYYCYGYNCGRMSRPSGGRGGSSSDCSDSNNNDAAGAIVVFFIIIALLLILVAAAPFIFGAVAILADLAVAVGLAIFDIITLGIFRSRFHRTSVKIHQQMSEGERNDFVLQVVAMGGIPKDYRPEYATWGFHIFRLGAFLIVPSLFAVLLVLAFHPTNRFLFWSPIVTSGLSILFLIWGSLLISNRRSAILAM